MARTNQSRLRFAAVISIFFLSLPLLPLESGAAIRASMNDEESRKMVLGSRPPACVNKCMSCRPCEATLVIPPHSNMRASSVKSSHGEGGSYYLLSWKCRCGDKIFQP